VELVFDQSASIWSWVGVERHMKRKAGLERAPLSSMPGRGWFHPQGDQLRQESDTD
jgi:hypothetical protein